MSLTLLFNQYFEAAPAVAPPPQLSGGFGGGSSGRGHWPPSTDLTPRRRKVKPRHRQIRKIERKLRRGVELVPHELEILSDLAGRAHNAPSGSQDRAGSPIAPLPALVEALTVNPSDQGLSQELADLLRELLEKPAEVGVQYPSDLTDLGGVDLFPPELVTIGEGIYPPIGPELDRRIRLVLLPPARVRLVPLPRVTPLEIEEEEMLVLALAVA